MSSCDRNVDTRVITTNRDLTSRSLRNVSPSDTGKWAREKVCSRAPCLQIPINQICLVSYGDASGGSTRAEQAQAGYVVMIDDQALFEGVTVSVL